MTFAPTSILFQFHDGTIKTGQRVKIHDKSPKFQFHDGTIKTEKPIYISIVNDDFNSMMVQLKLIDIYNGNLVFTEVSLRINVYFFRCKNVDV